MGRYGHEFRALFLSGESGVILNQQSPWHSVLKKAACQAAVNPGAIQVTWRKRVPLAGTSPPSDYSTTTNKYLLESGRYYRLNAVRYVVSGGAVKPPRKIYWTESSFSRVGKPIRVPNGLVGAIQVVYNNGVPEYVDTEYVSTGETPMIQPPADPNDPAEGLQEKRTLWYDGLQGMIHAYNREGRVFMELLGDARGPSERVSLGYEIVDIIREPSLEDVTVELGERLTAYADGEDDSELFPEEIIQTSGVGTAFVYRQVVKGSERATFYAVRETRNPNDQLVHWLERGEMGLLWPKLTVRYNLIWPDDVAKYSHYVRPLVATQSEAEETAVTLPTQNAPFIYEDLDQPREFLTPDLRFYTFLTPAVPAHRTLIRFTAGNTVAFERIFSWLDENLKSGVWPDGSTATRLSAWNGQTKRLEFPTEDTFAAPRVINLTVRVGRRIPPPNGELGATADEDYWAGHLRTAVGTSYHPGAYIDPFASGFTEAQRGAIIPVNAIPNRNQLEVWWFRKNRFEHLAGYGTILWPSVLGRYTIAWPANPREIVLASNDGSGGLVSLEAKGSIYYQNDRTQHGYNPNEEHALMIGGQAYALRDDLNVISADDSYTSEPCVLLEYTEADRRPAMIAFKVLREKPAAGIVFNYTVEAGTILQAPMPMPLLERPLVARETGEPFRSLNQELLTAEALQDSFSPGNTAVDYARFTLQDRKGNVWVYRGPHDATDVSSMTMKFYYKTLPGFFFPSRPLENQPPVGTITPYLRVILPDGQFEGADIAGDANGDRVGDGNPLPIVYRPSWPVNAPVMLRAETLTLPKRGLPSVRGQTSLEIVYEQSHLHRDGSSRLLIDRASRTVRLHDPTREKEFFLWPRNDEEALDQANDVPPPALGGIPDSIKTQQYRGKTFFPNLPPHLVERFFFDPNRGRSGALVLKGKFVDAPLGEDYLLLNVLGQKDLLNLADLCLAGDLREAKWDEAIAGLETKMELFQNLRPSRHLHRSDRPDGDVGPGAAGGDERRCGGGFLRVDGGRRRYWVCVADRRQWPGLHSPEEPTSVLVVKVVDRYFAGEVKVIESSNPLSELLTMQQVVDLAGQVQDYAFDWKIAAAIDGQEPAVMRIPPPAAPGQQRLETRAPARKHGYASQHSSHRRGQSHGGCPAIGGGGQRGRSGATGSPQASSSANSTLRPTPAPSSG